MRVVKQTYEQWIIELLFEAQEHITPEEQAQFERKKEVAERFGNMLVDSLSEGVGRFHLEPDNCEIGTHEDRYDTNYLIPSFSISSGRNHGKLAGGYLDDKPMNIDISVSYFTSERMTYNFGKPDASHENISIKTSIMPFGKGIGKFWFSSKYDDPKVILKRYLTKFLMVVEMMKHEMSQGETPYVLLDGE